MNINAAMHVEFCHYYIFIHDQISQIACKCVFVLVQSVVARRFKENFSRFYRFFFTSVLYKCSQIKTCDECKFSIYANKFGGGAKPNTHKQYNKIGVFQSIDSTNISCSSKYDIFSQFIFIAIGRFRGNHTYFIIYYILEVKKFSYIFQVKIYEISLLKHKHTTIKHSGQTGKFSGYSKRNKKVQRHFDVQCYRRQEYT